MRERVGGSFGHCRSGGRFVYRFSQSLHKAPSVMMVVSLLI